MSTVGEVFTLALQLHQHGDLHQAEQLYRQVLEVDHQHADCHHLMGLLAYQQGNHVAAVAAIRQALALNPQAAIFHYNLGVVYEAGGQPAEALASFQKSLTLQPNSAEAQNAAGNACRALGNLDLAVSHYLEAIKCRSDYPEAHNDLGCALFMQNKVSEAANHYQTALQLRPNFPDAFNNLGLVYEKQGELEAAASSFQQALKLHPRFAAAFNNFGSFLLGQGRVDEALQSFKQALQAAPELASAQSNFLFCLNHQPRVDRDAVFEQHVRWGREQESTVSRMTHQNDPSPERRLRIGYVSPDFRRHALVRYFEPVLAHHDSNLVEIFCYAEVSQPDDTTSRLQHLAHGWRSTCRMTDTQLAQQIQSDKIDILVDLAGHTANNRLRALACKPAPIQATWLGYLNTTGLSAIDYRITDEFLDPPGAPVRDTETLVRLKSGMCCFSPPKEAPAVSALPAMRRGHVTFGSLHNLAKINTAVIDLWSGVLMALPTARMFMVRDTLAPQAQSRLKEQFAQRGIEEHRLDMRQGSIDQAYLASYSAIDICLDVIPWSGGVTTCESLWMGVPVLTLCGARPPSRNAAGILNRLGLSGWVARSSGEYVELADRLTQELAPLAELRLTLRDSMRTNLCDARRFTRELEETYRTMWRHWCGGDAQSQRGSS